MFVFTKVYIKSIYYSIIFKTFVWYKVRQVVLQGHMYATIVPFYPLGGLQHLRVKAKQFTFVCVYIQLFYTKPKFQSG